MATNTGILAKALGRTSVAELHAKIAELLAGIESGRAALAKLQAERAESLQDWLKDKPKAATDNAQAIIAEQDTITALEQRRELLVAELRKATTEREQSELDARWAASRKQMKDREAEIAKFQKMLDAVGVQAGKVFDLTQKMWDALPERPPNRPPLFGNDFYKQANLYLFGASEGHMGISHMTPFVTRERIDLVRTDGEVQRMLLLPLERKVA